VAFYFGGGAMSFLKWITGFVALSVLSVMFTNCSNLNSDSGDSPSSPNQGQGGFQDNRSLTCDVKPVQITHTQGFVENPTQTLFVDTKTYPSALCNDGSPAVFSIRPGFGDAQKRWVMYLEGGASCWDQQTCTDRANETPDLISSNAYINAPLLSGFGVVAPSPINNPDLYDATVVHIHYCSSDGWTGTKIGDAGKPGVIPDSWHFQGHAIVQAVIQTLKAQYGLNGAAELMLVGSSAGGVGVFNNLGWVSQNIPASIRFVAANDAGFINEVAGYDVNQPDGVSLAAGTPYDLVNPIQVAAWGATGDMFCEMKAVTAQDHINCGLGPKLAAATTGELRVPLFVRQSLADGVQLKQEGLDLQSNPPKQQNQGYQMFFGQKMRDALNGANNFVSAFAAAQNIHGQMDNTDYYKKQYTFGAETLTIQQALGIWYQDPCNLKKWIQ
jgi:hypothetical protein